MNITVDPDLTLKLYSREDVPALHKIISEEKKRLQDWLNSVQHISTKHEVDQFITQNNKAFEEFTAPSGKSVLPGFQFGIFCEGALIGQVGFQAINRKHDMASVGYWITEKAEGRGLITRSCKALVAFGFKEVQLNRIEIQAAVDNLRSAKVAERMGFTKEGILAQVEKRQDGYTDHYLYRMLREDWPAE